MKEPAHHLKDKAIMDITRKDEVPVDYRGKIQRRASLHKKALYLMRVKKNLLQ